MYRAYLCKLKISVMKNLILLVLALLGFFAIACNNSNKKNGSNANSGNEPITIVDSLLKDIDEGHILGMSKIGKLHNMQKAVQRAIDSIGKLPANALQAVSPYIVQLNAAIKDLEYADFAMEKWMTEFDMDSALDNMEHRIKYLTDEKLKVSKMKEAILTSMQKADSLLKAKL